MKTTIPATELADRVIDVAERVETSDSDRDVLYAAAESYDELRSREVELLATIGELRAEAANRVEKEQDLLDKQDKFIGQLQAQVGDLNARLYGIALLLKH